MPCCSASKVKGRPNAATPAPQAREPSKCPIVPQCVPWPGSSAPEPRWRCPCRNRQGRGGHASAGNAHGACGQSRNVVSSSGRNTNYSVRLVDEETTARINMRRHEQLVSRRPSWRRSEVEVGAGALALAQCPLRPPGRRGQVSPSHSAVSALVTANRPGAPDHFTSAPPSAPPANRPSDCKVL